MTQSHNLVMFLHNSTDEVMNLGKFLFVGAPCDFVKTIQDGECWSCAGFVNGRPIQPKFSSNLEDILLSVFWSDAVSCSLPDYDGAILKIIVSHEGWLVELYEDLLRGNDPVCGKTLTEVCKRLDMRVHYYETTRQENPNADL